MQLALATFLGALVVGLLASVARPWLREPRIALTVPGIIIMVPGTHAFQTVVLLGQGNVLAALEAASLGAFVVGAMALGLAAARLASPAKLMETLHESFDPRLPPPKRTFADARVMSAKCQLQTHAPRQMPRGG